MKIAQIAPIVERIPPRKYGGTERMVHDLTEELVRRGHDVTLFASKDSQTSAKLVSVVDNPLREMNVNDLYGSNFWTMLNIGVAYARQNEFDIIHDHSGHLSLPVANLSVTPVVMTLHGPLTLQNKTLYATLNNPHLVTISKSQSVPAPNLNYLGTVLHGLDMQNYSYSKDNDGYLLYVGRVSEEKGVHHAIEVAEYLHLPLVIAAKVDEHDRKYFKEKIEPHLGGLIRWIGEVDQDERNRLMSRALCFLHPALWREPFGLTLIEAAACGCPVVAFKRGSIPEIIQDGKTGFVVEDVEEMVEAVSQIQKIKRRECRKHALNNFSTSRMAAEYEKLYIKALQKRALNGQVSQIKEKLSKQRTVLPIHRKKSD
jgi:glycosyltransferase involved in cell wall biosynthesis